MKRIGVVICGSALDSQIAIALMGARLSHESFMPIVAVPDVPTMQFEIRRASEAIDIETDIFNDRMGFKKTGHDNFKLPEFHHNSHKIKKRGWGK